MQLCILYNSTVFVVLVLPCVSHLADVKLRALHEVCFLQSTNTTWCMLSGKSGAVHQPGVRLMARPTGSTQADSPCCMACATCLLLSLCDVLVQVQFIAGAHTQLLPKYAKQISCLTPGCCCCKQPWEDATGTQHKARKCRASNRRFPSRLLVKPFFLKAILLSMPGSEPGYNCRG